MALKTYSGVSYDPSVDYQAQINATKDPVQLQSLQESRAAKILGEQSVNPNMSQYVNTIPTQILNKLSPPSTPSVTPTPTTTPTSTQNKSIAGPGLDYGMAAKAPTTPGAGVTFAPMQTQQTTTTPTPSFPTAQTPQTPQTPQATTKTVPTDMGYTAEFQNVPTIVTPEGQKFGVRDFFQKNGYDVLWDNGKVFVKPPGMNDYLEIQAQNLQNNNGTLWATQDQMKLIASKVNTAIMEYNAKQEEAAVQKANKEGTSKDLLKNKELTQEAINQKNASIEPLMKQIAGFQDYKSPYKQYSDNLLAQAIAMNNEGFKYDPNTDQSLKVAQNQIMQATREDAAKRGALYGDTAQSMVAQEVAKVAPQFEQNAYNRFNDRFTRNINLANQIIAMDSEAYKQNRDKFGQLVDTANLLRNLGNDDVQTYITMQNQLRTDRQFAYDEAYKASELKLKEYSKALETVNTFQYVDNETAKILGIPPGTPAWQAKQYLMTLSENERIRQDEIKQKKIDSAREFDQKVALAKIQEGLTRGTLEQRGAQEMAQIKQQGQQALNLENVRSANNITEMRKKNELDRQADSTKKSQYYDAVASRIDDYVSYLSDEQFTKMKAPGTAENKRFVDMIANSMISDAEALSLFSMYGVPFPKK